MENVTIDDASTSLSYYPASAWNARSTTSPCLTCTANPEIQSFFDETFHDGTFNALPGSNDFPNVPLTASMIFNGTAVYVFCALAESSTSPDGDSDMSFYVDGTLQGTFVKTAPGIDNTYEYTVNVFSIHSLMPGLHNLSIHNGHVNGSKSLMLLDKVVYTTFNENLNQNQTTSASFPSSSSQPASANNLNNHPAMLIIVLATVIPVIISIAIIVWCMVFFMKRRKQQHQRLQTPRHRHPFTAVQTQSESFSYAPLCTPNTSLRILPLDMDPSSNQVSLPSFRSSLPSFNSSGSDAPPAYDQHLWSDSPEVQQELQGADNFDVLQTLHSVLHKKFA
ncbi:hypothetical protein F5880DRAFT_1611250 [Lentinula raphanica]|nr:hypothetical protein F5880DRAFT_1611250 [Lentinula raphanica]